MSGGDGGKGGKGGAGNPGAIVVKTFHVIAGSSAANINTTPSLKKVYKFENFEVSGKQAW
jgi:hypothetical protein